jgi:hypothetical protein
MHQLVFGCPQSQALTRRACGLTAKACSTRRTRVRILSFDSELSPNARSEHAYHDDVRHGQRLPCTCTCLVFDSSAPRLPLRRSSVTHLFGLPFGSK